ncbi:MAG: hypothetical protein R3182_14395 [Draconibacterium sp.]|nr:hypothetical protein [Draconibacterium sp.]
MNYTVIFVIIIAILLLIAVYFIWKAIKNEKRKKEWLETLEPSDMCEIKIPTSLSLVAEVKSVTEDEVVLKIKLKKHWIYPHE